MTWVVATVVGLSAAAPAWTHAWRSEPSMSAAEARVFIRRLADFVVARHMKRDESPQRGMIYEYHWVRQAGTPRQWIQGEALDTMHDGAWFAVAMAEAARVTGDVFYREILLRWPLPFYLRMLPSRIRCSPPTATTRGPGAIGRGAPAWNGCSKAARRGSFRTGGTMAPP